MLTQLTSLVRLSDLNFEILDKSTRVTATIDSLNHELGGWTANLDRPARRLGYKETMAACRAGKARKITCIRRADY